MVLVQGCTVKLKILFFSFFSKGQFLRDITCFLPYLLEIRWLVTKMPDPQISNCHIFLPSG